MDTIKDKISDFLGDDFSPEQIEETVKPLPDTDNPLVRLDDKDMVNMETGEIVPIEPSEGQKKFAKEAEEDFDLVRSAMRDAVINGSVVLDRMTALSAQHQEGSWFKVYGDYLEKFAVTADAVMGLHQKKDTLSAFIDSGPPAEENTGGININGDGTQIVFTGTTAEFKDQLKRQRSQMPPIEHEDIDDDDQ